jgi:hypothetical protein
VALMVGVLNDAQCAVDVALNIAAIGALVLQPSCGGRCEPSDETYTTGVTPVALTRPHSHCATVVRLRSSPPFTRPLTHSFTESHTQSLTLFLTHPPTYPLTHSPTHPLTHSLTNPLTHSLTHSLTHPFTHLPYHLSTLHFRHLSRCADDFVTSAAKGKRPAKQEKKKAPPPSSTKRRRGNDDNDDDDDDDDNNNDDDAGDNTNFNFDATDDDGDDDDGDDKDADADGAGEADAGGKPAAKKRKPAASVSVPYAPLCPAPSRCGALSVSASHMPRSVVPPRDMVHSVALSVSGRRDVVSVPSARKTHHLHCVPRWPMRRQGTMTRVVRHISWLYSGCVPSLTVTLATTYHLARAAESAGDVCAAAVVQQGPTHRVPRAVGVTGSPRRRRNNRTR